MSVWPDRPPNWQYPGHIDLGGEREQILDRIEVSGWDLTTYKPVITTIVSNATLTNDPHLFFDVDANAVYRINLNLVFSSTATTINTGSTGPTGSAVLGGRVMYQHTVTSGGLKLFAWISTAAMFGVAGLPSHGAAVGYPAFMTGILTTGSVAGRFNFQWSQGASTASNTSLHEGSYMEALRIA